MSDPNQLDDTILSSSANADDMATLRVTSPALVTVPDDLQTLIVAKAFATQPDCIPLPTGANPDAAVPFIFGRRIAQGGMGAILEASDCKLGRTIAVKVMLSEAGRSEDQKQRFIQEAAVLGRLEHPNIVPIHDLGRDSAGQLYYTMKLVKGRTLQYILDRLRSEDAEMLAHYTLDRLLTIFRKVCDALAFAHAQQIIHRDLKPENIMVGEFGEVLVMDWGISKILDGSVGTACFDSDESSKEPSPRPLTATRDGAVMGTPNYMSPEQAMGKVNEMDARSDIFSLGGILYCIVTLRPPVEGKDVWEVLEKVTSANITAPTTYGTTAGKGKPTAKGEALEAKNITPLPHMPGGRVPSALSAVAMKALMLDKAKRYQDVAAFSADIEKYQNGFATIAESAGRWKRFTLFVRRNKAAAIGVATGIILTVGFMAKVIAEGRRAELGEAKAKAALADLKASAPALLQLAENEADSQRFESARQKIDAALALDSTLPNAWWQRAWALLGQQRWSDAMDALRLARQHDPANAQLASILPVVEKIAAAPEAERWTSDAAREVFVYLQSVKSVGPSLAFSRHLNLNMSERVKLVTSRLSGMLNKDDFIVIPNTDGSISVAAFRKPIRSLEPFRSLPIDSLDLAMTHVSDLEPIKGMHLTGLNVANTKVSDISPLRGMPLHTLQLANTGVGDLSVLKGMPLYRLFISGTKVTDLSPITGAPIKELALSVGRITDYTPVFTLLQLELLHCLTFPAELLPLRQSKSLQSIYGDAYPGEGAQRARPVAEFWRAYDAHQTAKKK